MDNSLDEYRFWFANLDIGNDTKCEILREYLEEKRIYLDRNKIYKSKKYVDKKLINILNDIDMALFKKAKENDLKIASKFDKIYPKALNVIEDEPTYLFYYGDITVLTNRNNTSIVGARRCSNYGREVTQIVAKELSRYGINIVSGGALGIDSVAHNTALLNGTTTCAVLGCGVDVPYPAYNRALFEKIKANGCIISEFRMSTPPFNYNFPKRNRIISALSGMTIVIEGTLKSGSMITATHALAQGKDVMAVPGNIFSDLSQGPNSLIRDGAFVLDSVERIRDYYSFLVVPKYNIIKTSSKIKESILELLSQGPKHIDEIIRFINVDTSDIYKVLFEMQFDNEIISLLGNYYSKVN